MSDIDLFVENPGEYFGSSLTRMMSLAREDLHALQLAGLKRRFERFRNSVPMLARLADIQGIDALHDLDDVLPLLFDPSTYKSFPASLLDKHRYVQLTAWLSKLTTFDLSAIDVSACRSLDEWMITLARETPLALVHTSGTSGTMSFLPRSKLEFIRFAEQFPVQFFQRFGHDVALPKPPLNIDCIYPFFRSGGLSHPAFNDAIVAVIAGSEERFHAAYPERLSADLMLIAARQRAAASKGQTARLEISPELMARREEFEAQQRRQPDHMAKFFATMRTRLAGRQIFMVAPTHLLASLAESGLKEGMRGIFAPQSVIVCGGGGKGTVLPDGWQAKVSEFFGVARVNLIYGMTEMSGVYPSCEQGHYHSVPWVIPFVLDPDTAKPFPRSGRVTGRFAFFDLIPESRWGGFITGDKVTMEWDAPCPCGQTSPYIVGSIERLSDTKNDAGEEKLSCAAAPAAYAEALGFLNENVI